jgi:glycosyltransferase involved in cell wall biosynthesis
VNLACKKIFTARSCRAEKLRVVMNSPDEIIFKYKEVLLEPPIQSGASRPFVLMYHGSIVERHGLDMAVEALEIVKKSVPNVRLRIYGAATPFLHQVLDQLEARGLENCVEYLGGKNLDQIAAAIDQCDVGIIPNRRSIFTEINTPTRIFEYLARAKPVIAPQAGGIQDYFGNDSLVLFELGNATDLARKIEYVFSRPGEVREIVKRGQKIYRTHKWSEERAGFLTLVRELLNCASEARENRMMQAIKPDTAVEHSGR